MALSNASRIVRRRKSRPGPVAGGRGLKAQRAGGDWDTGPVAALPAADAVQRKCAACEKAESGEGPETASRQPEEEEAQTAGMPGEKVSRQEEEEEAQAKPMAGERIARQDEEEEEAQAKPVAGERVARQDEEEEAQAKPMAGERVARQDEEEEEAQTKPVAGERIARQEEEEEVQAFKPKPPGGAEPKEPVSAQRAAETGPASGGPGRSGGDASAAGGSISGHLRQARGGGRQLDDSTRSFMESRFGRDLSQVRVHTDPRADTLNRRLKARAFTNGNDIYFRQGQYDSARSDGLKLLAHELTHVVQQRGDLVPRVDRQAAAGPPAAPCPKPVAKVHLNPILTSGTLPTTFGETRMAQSKVPFVSLLQRERRSGTVCGADGKQDGWDLCVRRGVLYANVPVVIDTGELAKRGASGERWFQDCNEALPTPAFVTPADARTTMTTPKPLTVAGVRRHELYHVSVGERLLKERLEARNDHRAICPYDRAAIDAWRTAVQASWQSDALAFLRSSPTEPNEEANAVKKEC